MHRTVSSPDAQEPTVLKLASGSGGLSVSGFAVYDGLDTEFGDHPVTIGSAGH